MKQVFRLIVQIESLNVDLYFEDENSVEKTVDYLTNQLTDKAKKKIKFAAEIHEVYSKDTAIEQIIQNLGLLNKND